MMLDYKLVEAFSVVIQEGGFERASKSLHITQSAVSQRVKLLEDQVGQILLRRTNPPEPTIAGKNMLRHYLQVNLLEGDLFKQVQERAADTYTNMTLAINADSLATWFFGSIVSLLQEEQILLDLRVDDQEQTHRLFKDGEVVGCISTKDNPFQGCGVSYLGTMDYQLMASPAFMKRWFPKGFTISAIDTTPAVIFNRKDELHHKYLQRCFGEIPENFPVHYVPSPEKFLEFIVMDLGYGMLPLLQCESHLQQGILVPLAPELSEPVPLYYHFWNLKSKLLERIKQHITSTARKNLRQ